MRKGDALSWHNHCEEDCMKNLILCCLATISLVTLVACCDDNRTTTTATDQSASMQTDTKEMKK
jgi:hypothetical protein